MSNNTEKYNGKYADIIELKHYQSNKRPHMTMYNRAAQFAPFAALTGFEEKIDQTAQSRKNLIKSDESSDN